jgi:hypothetical protein
MIAVARVMAIKKSQNPREMTRYPPLEIEPRLYFYVK